MRARSLFTEDDCFQEASFGVWTSRKEVHWILFAVNFAVVSGCAMTLGFFRLICHEGKFIGILPSDICHNYVQSIGPCQVWLDHLLS